MISLYNLFESREDPRIYDKHDADMRAQVKASGGIPLFKPGLGFKRFAIQKKIYKYNQGLKRINEGDKWEFMKGVLRTGSMNKTIKNMVNKKVAMSSVPGYKNLNPHSFKPPTIIGDEKS